ncbi:hypothetical protein E0Z06_13345 [Rheinheimera sp. D18]|uniref:hypothetical protein n=1 Tax=Rheinheimera sp. D18 TaxID=2545632 RepID=UPI00104A4CBF|nr:hypothetical protein [Rheinheimera sp. D18]QBL10444.1 hypothetical protein E0Z06_13345 [Rheinheimera sp. D18]
MAMTLEDTKKILDSIGLKYNQLRNEEDHAVLLLSWSIDKDPEVGEYDVDILLTLTEPSKNGFEFMMIRSKGLEKDLNFHEAEQDKQFALFKYMVDRNSTIKVGRWGFDQDDGEIVVDHPIILEKDSLAQDQLERAIRIMVTEVKKGYVVLRRIKQSGDPEQEILNSNSIFDELLISLATKAPHILANFVMIKPSLIDQPDTLRKIKLLVDKNDFNEVEKIVRTL